MFHIEVERDNRGLTCAYAVNDLGHIYCGAEAGQTGMKEEAIRELKKLFMKHYPDEQLDKNDIRLSASYEIATKSTKGGTKLSTELYEFTDSTDAVPPPPPPPDLGVPTAPEPEPAPPEEPAQASVMTADLVALDLMRASQYTIVIRLLPHDNDPAGRLCTLGVQLDKQAPSITVIRGNDLGVLPDPIWQLMQAQAQLAATKPDATAKKKAEIPPPLTTRTVKPAPAAKTAPVPAPTAAPAKQAPAPVAAQAQNDIYSLFDL